MHRMGNFRDQEEVDEEEEEEEEEGGPRMLGIIFGNIDESGALDEEYLDQETKEHLSALTIDLTDPWIDIQESGVPSNVNGVQEDYDRKADSAEDYEDIQEDYVESKSALHSQDEEAISQDQSFYAQAALAGSLSRLEEDENYDEDEDYDKEEHGEEDRAGKDLHQEQVNQDMVQINQESVQTFEEELVVSRGAEPSMPLLASESVSKGVENDNISSEKNIAENTIQVSTKEVDVHRLPTKFNLPVLYEEDGKAVLRFSELFGPSEFPLVCRKEKRHQKRHSHPKDKCIFSHPEYLEDDDQALLSSGSTKKGFVDRILDYSADSDRIEADETIRNLSSDSRQNHHAFKSAQPMKEGQGDWHSILERIHVPSPTLQPIHQEDWEAAILWDAGCVLQVREDPIDNALESSGFIKEMDVDTREDDASCMKATDECWQASMENFSCDVMKINQRWHTSRPVVLESFNHEPSPKCNSLLRHPQLLRLEALPALREVDNVHRVADQLQKLKLQSSELLSESWVDNIVWDDDNVSNRKSRSKVIFNLQDNQMMFVVPESKSGNHLRAHAAAMIVPSHCRSSNRTDSVDAHHLGVSSLARFNISNDKYYMNKKNPQQQKSSLKKRSVHGIKVMHSIPATKLQTMKPKLANKDLANFHRPKAVWYPHHNEVAAKEQGNLSVAGPMKVILKTMGGKGSKLNVDAAESWESFKTKLLKKFRDLRTSEKIKIFYCGKELETVRSLAQQEVKPNSVLHLVRTKIHPWPKAQRLPGENKPMRPPGAFKKKSDLSVKDGHAFIAEYCEERPLLMNNVGMGARLCTYYRKVSPTDSIAAMLRNDKDASVGSIVPLEPMEDSPFLGDIRPGETQACFETNMFRAPAFHHKVQHTDFLLVRSPKGKLSIRRIDRSFVIGQQEPHMEVLTPGSKTVQSYLHNRLLTYVYRGFRNIYKPGTVTRLRADEISLLFPSLSEGFVKKHLRHCADFQRVSVNESWWIMKQNFRIPSEEELRRMLTPENVCSYESMQAGLYHLKRMGVSKFTQPSGLSTAMNQLPDEALVLAAASHLERELQITPWNLSCNFVAATMQGRGSLERLEITGAGDPSGRGLGFSYLRAAPKPPSSTALVEKKAAAARGGGAVTGTDADLRRLSMDAARAVLLKFNVPESQIEKLTRWHRIALVRKLSSEQAASGVKLGASALNKFARGQRMSFLQLQQQTREKCQEIWDRQVQSLSAALEENSESEGEANEDLDSFAGDLENLLEAEEGEIDEVASTKAKKEAIRGPGARRRALEAQREEDIEDEEAEAAELRRMLMDDDEAEEVKKKKKTVTSEKAPEDPSKEQSKAAPDENKSNIRKKKIIKRIIRTMKPDGTYTSKEILITDPKEVAQYLARKNAGENGNLTKEKKGPFLSKKFKQAGILKDGKKLKKATKGEGGRDGVQLVCGACKQVGHMRTNKKVCPMYTEEAKANIPKAENIEPSEPPVRQGIKITLKSAAGAVQEQEQLFSPPAVSLPPPATSLPLKLPSLKIKLPIPGIVDAAVGSTTKVVENPATPLLQEISTADAPKVVDEGLRFIKKIKVQKRPSVNHDKLHNHNEQAEVRELHKSHHSEVPLQADKQKTPQSMYARYQSPHEMEAENVVDVLARQKEGEWLSPAQSEQDRLQKERIDEIRRRKEKKRMKEEKERRKAREKEEKRRRRREEEEEREQLRIERQRELEEQADAQRRMLERRKEEEWQEFLWRERQREELERQQQQAAREQAEREKVREKLVIRAIRPPARDRKSLEWDRSVGTKRRGFVEVDDVQEDPEYCHQPKRRKGGEVLLANILEGIVDQLKKAREISFLFQKPVAKKDAPDYHDIIKNPMDLSTIREKARNLVYKSRGQFRRDVFQIAENAHIYNDVRNPGIPPLADRLLDLCDGLLRDKARDLTDAESSIEWFGEESAHATSSRTTNRRTSRPR